MKVTPKQLADLVAKQLPRMCGADAATIPASATPDDAEKGRALLSVLDTYLHPFVKGDGNCILCGKKQGAKDIGDILLGASHFTWGLTHGEGFCSNCGYPARAYHFIDGVGRLNLILQYHPEELTMDAE